MKTIPTRTVVSASIILAVLLTANAAPPARVSPSKRPVIYNLDCSEFFVGTFGPVKPETIDKFVEEHARAGVTHLFINVNAQRVNYRSKVWDAAWDGMDPDADDNQPFFAGIDPNSVTPWVDHPALFNDFPLAPNMIRFAVVFDGTSDGSDVPGDVLADVVGLTNLRVRVIPD